MWRNPCAMLIRDIHLQLTKRSDNALRQHQLTMAQLVALLLLKNAPEKELTLKELERLLRVSQPDAAGLVLRLEKKGMVVGFADVSDKRIKRVRITAQAERYCGEAEGNMAATESILLSGMTEGEQQMFCELLRRALNNILSN